MPNLHALPAKTTDFSFFGGFMKRLIGTTKCRRSALLASALAPICFGVLLASAGQSRLQNLRNAPAETVYPHEIKIVNNTTSLDATFEITANNHLLLKLKNLSPRDMNGYVVTANGARITKEISIGDRFVSSGQSDEFEMPISSSSKTITILAAMFTDGTIEAEPVLKKELTEWRLGMKEELVRNLAALDEILSSPDVYSTEALDRLGSSLSLASDPDTVYSTSEIGARNVRETFKSQLQSLKERAQRNGNAMQRQRLVDLKSRIERRIASL